jgi:hypothetical protein
VPKRPAKKKRLTEAQILLERHLGELGLRNVEVEHRFAAPMRQWASDYFLPHTHSLPLAPSGVLIEIEGGAWSQGRHTRGEGYSEDCLKYSTASAMGFKVFRFTTQQVLTGEAKSFLARWL